MGFTLVSAICFAALAAAGDAPLHEAELIFDPEQAIESHGHVHASSIVVCPNGDLRAVWYENGPALPAPFFSEQKDKSADVRIGGSRKQAGAKTWDEPFVMNDTFGVSDNNPCMVVDNQSRLWLFHATLLGVPEWSWGSCIVRYMYATRYDQPGRPMWDTSSILVPQVGAYDDVLKSALESRKADGWPEADIEKARQYVKTAASRALSKRVGWMPRARPLVRNDGALLLPLANENGGAACMAITKDSGKTWEFSALVPDLGLAQPTVVQFDDGTLSAFFRNDSGRIKRSDSSDGGMTWGPVTKLDLANPNAGVEALVLKSGRLAIVYNDKEKERDSLAISLSEDRGKTWKWTRHLENETGGRFDYPSIVEAGDGALHATYSVGTKAIKHAQFNEAWIMAE